MTQQWDAGGGTYQFDTVINGKPYECSMLFWKYPSCYEADKSGSIRITVGLRAYEK